MLKRIRWIIKFEAERCSSVLTVSVKLLLFYSFRQKFPQKTQVSNVVLHLYHEMASAG